MTECEFEVIVKCIRAGAPAMAHELISSLTSVLEQNATLTKALETTDKPDKEA